MATAHPEPRMGIAFRAGDDYARLPLPSERPPEAGRLPGFDRIVVVTRDRDFRLWLTAAEGAGMLGGWHHFASAAKAHAAALDFDEGAVLFVVDAMVMGADGNGARETFGGAGEAAACGPLRGIRRTWPEARVLAAVGEATKPLILQLLDRGAHGIVAKSAGARSWCDAIRTLAGGGIHVPAEVADLQPWSGGRSSRAGEGFEAGEFAQMLTPRQRQVLQRLVAGKSNKEIARDLDLREGTVKVHLAAVLRNLKVDNRTAAAAVGARLLMEAGFAISQADRRYLGAPS